VRSIAWDDAVMTITSPARPVTHIGWGYEGRSVEDLVREARLRGVTVVVDVRLNAISRRKGFSKRALGERLAEEGIAYVHLRELGNPRDNRAGFAEVGTADGRKVRERYRREVLHTESGARGLAALMEHEQAIVLCFEAEERCCHRAQVLEAVRELRASEERQVRG
jgi:uncharacterized protein (DUF488 family)